MIKGDHDLPQTGKGVGHARTPRDRAGLEAAGAGLSSARRSKEKGRRPDNSAYSRASPERACWIRRPMFLWRLPDRQARILPVRQ